MVSCLSARINGFRDQVGVGGMCCSEMAALYESSLGKTNCCAYSTQTG